MFDLQERAVPPVQPGHATWQEQPRWHDAQRSQPIVRRRHDRDDDVAEIEVDDDDEGPSHAAVLALCAAYRVVPTRDVVRRALRNSWLAVC